MEERGILPLPATEMVCRVSWISKLQKRNCGLIFLFHVWGNRGSVAQAHTCNGEVESRFGPTGFLGSHMEMGQNAPEDEDARK